ncbi:carbohydrate-binding family 9-like protein [Candidatus Latescibacterota bacterium]
MLSRLADLKMVCRLLQGISILLFVIAGCSENEIEPGLNTIKKNSGEETALPSYMVPRTTVPIDIDGRLDELDWKQAEERVMVDAYTGGETPLKSTFRMLWDDLYLYVGVYFEDHDAWATYTEEDDPLWEEEVLELFIDADCDGNTYYEHEINPINAKVDLFLHRNRTSVDSWREWDFKHIRSAVSVEGDGKNAGTEDNYWIIEVAVPFEDLYEMPHVPPEDGDMWRMNVYRIERDNPVDKKEVFLAAFSPPYSGNFHATWMFGKIYFKK